MSTIEMTPDGVARKARTNPITGSAMATTPLTDEAGTTVGSDASLASPRVSR